MKKVWQNDFRQGSRNGFDGDGYQVEVGGVTVEITRKNIRNLHLRVDQASGKVQLSAPLRVSESSLRKFIFSKIGWINKQQSKFGALQRQPQKGFVSGEIHHHFGKPYWLNVVYEDIRPKVEIVNETQIDLWVRMASNQVQRERVMMEWYRSRLKAEIPILIQKWQTIVGVEVEDWGVKKMRSRWGSCNKKARRIWVNLELAKMPFEFLEFIIVHELTHMLERHHNESFRSLMDTVMPEWRSYHKELKRFVLPL